MYVDGKLVWGEEPDGTKFVAEPCTKSSSGSTTTQTTAPKPTETTTTTTVTTTESTTTTTSSTSKPEDTTTPTTESKPVNGGSTENDGGRVWGDANLDGDVSVADAVLIMQSIANPSKYGQEGTESTHLTRDGALNGDVYENGTGITAQDALSIQKYKLNLIDKLPESVKQ